MEKPFLVCLLAFFGKWKVGRFSQITNPIICMVQLVNSFFVLSKQPSIVAHSLIYYTFVPTPKQRFVLRLRRNPPNDPIKVQLFVQHNSVHISAPLFLHYYYFNHRMLKYTLCEMVSVWSNTTQPWAANPPFFLKAEMPKLLPLNQKPSRNPLRTCFIHFRLSVGIYSVSIFHHTILLIWSHCHISIGAIMPDWLDKHIIKSENWLPTKTLGNGTFSRLHIFLGFNGRFQFHSISRFK